MKSFDDDITNVVYAPPEYMDGLRDDHLFPEEDNLITPSRSQEPVTSLLYAPPEYMGLDKTSSWDEDQETEVYPYSHAATAPDMPSDPGNPIGDIYGGPDLLWDNKETGMDTVYGGPRGRGLAAAINAIISKLKGDS